MTLSVLVLSNLDERLAWLKHRLRFLYVSGHQGETVVGVWGGHDKIPDLQSFCDALSPQIRVVSQSGEQRITSRIIDLAKGAIGEHVVMQGDDDFLLPSAFENPLHLLKNDASVLCAQGRVMSLALGQGPTMIDWFPLWQALEDETLPRFSGFMKNACTTWHAMYRRAQFIERMSYMDEALVNTKVYGFYEALGELYSVIKGKIVIFDEIYLVKGLHSQSGAHTFKQGLSDKMPPYIVTVPRQTLLDRLR